MNRSIKRSLAFGVKSVRLLLHFLGFATPSFGKYHHAPALEQIIPAFCSVRYSEPSQQVRIGEFVLFLLLPFKEAAVEWDRRGQSFVLHETAETGEVNISTDNDNLTWTTIRRFLRDVPRVSHDGGIYPITVP